MLTQESTELQYRLIDRAVALGWLKGRQLTKGQPWQIGLSDSQISALRERIARNTNQAISALHDILQSVRTVT